MAHKLWRYSHRGYRHRPTTRRLATFPLPAESQHFAASASVNVVVVAVVAVDAQSLHHRHRLRCCLCCVSSLLVVQPVFSVRFCFDQFVYRRPPSRCKCKLACCPKGSTTNAKEEERETAMRNCCLSASGGVKAKLKKSKHTTWQCYRQISYRYL